MKRFEELNELERKNASKANVKKIVNVKSFITVFVCIASAILLAFLWTIIYTNFQKNRLDKIYQEMANENNTMLFNFGDASSSGIDSLSGTAENQSDYEDLSIEFVGAEKSSSSSDYLQLYLKVSNPNDKTLTANIKTISINDVTVYNAGSMSGLTGNQSTMITQMVKHSSILANQIGDEITKVYVQYYFEGEYGTYRECMDSDFSYRIGDLSVLRGDAIISMKQQEEKEEIKQDVLGMVDGGPFEKLKVQYTGYEETKSYYELTFLLSNESEEEYEIQFWYESDINEHTLEMKSSSEISSYTIPAGGATALSIKYNPKDLQYYGIQIINSLGFKLGNNSSSWSDASYISFDDLSIPVNETEITKNALNGKIEGTLSEGSIPEGVTISYVGCEITSSYVCLCFDIENSTNDYYGFAFWYDSKVNNCSLKMKSTSEISGELDAHDHVLLRAKYSPKELKAAGITDINDIQFSFAKDLNEKNNATTAHFAELEIAID